MVAYTILALLTNILYCQPIEGAWDLSIEARCYSIDLVIDFALCNSCECPAVVCVPTRKYFWLTYQYLIAFSIFSDVLLAVIPVPIVWNLQMARRLRLYLIGVLSLGYLCVPPTFRSLPCVLSDISNSCSAVAMCATKVYYQFHWVSEVADSTL